MPISVASRSRLPGLAVPLRAIVLTDDAESRTLNRSWRGIDRATDVLSFGYDDAPMESHVVSGDLVVSLDRLFEQARRFRVTPGEELARLVIHGTLHLCGHDHHRAGERTRMRAREARVMRGSRAYGRAMTKALATQ